jgi:hypothetical protein
MSHLLKGTLELGLNLEENKVHMQEMSSQQQFARH